MKKLLLITLSTTFLIINALAQPGSIDPTFNPSDIGFGTGDGFANDLSGGNFTGEVSVLKIMDNGKILAGGQFDGYNSNLQSYLTRINSDGTTDTTFQHDHIFVGDDEVSAIAVQADGKILVGAAGGGGGFQDIDELIVRFNEDGSQDLTFNALGWENLGISYAVKGIAPQPDGKILVAGNGVLRLNANGSIDPTFTGSGQIGFLNYLELQPDGKILIGGPFTNYQGSGLDGLVRLNSDGSLDLTFVTPPEVGSGNFILQPDGKIIAAATGGLIRLNTDGSIDPTFSGPGVNLIALQPDGKFMVKIGNNIKRLNSDGSADPSFTQATFSDINAIAVQPNNKCIVVGEFSTWNNIYCKRIVRLDSNGNRDFTFNPFSGINGISDPLVNAIAQQPDGKILVGGNFELFNGVARNNIVRLNANGSIDNAFDPGTGFDGEVNCIALQSDGKIVVGGGFTEFNGTDVSLIARLNTDGSLDGSFTSAGFSSTPVNSIAIQSDGKIIAGGDFEAYSGTSCKRIVRINSNGTIDNSFTIGTGFNSDGVKAVELQPDGKIICGGYFSSYNGTSSKGIVRLNTDGTIDNIFSVGTGFGISTVYDLELQPDGKIIATGSFSSYNGTSISKVARINSSGTLDVTFVPGTSVSFTPNAIALTSTGKLILGGSSYNTPDIIRLNSNGSIDQSFESEGSDGGIYAITIQSDEDILIGGYFTSFNGIGRNRIARLQGGSGNCSAGFTLSPDPNTQHNWFALNTCSGTPTITYDWNWGDGSSNSSGAYPSHTYSTAGYYNICVTITDGSGCTDTYCDNSTYIYKTAEMITVNVVNQLPTDIAERENGLLRVYPNPATNILTIETASGKGTYQLQDITGKVLLSGSVTATKFSLDISTLSKGIYLLSLIDGEQQVNRKVVKE